MDWTAIWILLAFAIGWFKGGQAVFSEYVSARALFEITGKNNSPSWPWFLPRIWYNSYLKRRD